MKLVSYNINNSQQMVRDTKPTIRVLGKYGLITFNRGLVRNMELKSGDKLEFFYNADQQLGGPDRPGDWYFCKSELGIPLRDNDKKNGKSLSINSATIARAILKGLKAASYEIAENSFTYEDKELYLIFNKPLRQL